jgi:competence transcription factor ComK
MIEIYVAVTLLGLGYILNLQSETARTPPKPNKQVSVNELNNAHNVYDSRFLETARKLEYAKAQDLYNKAAKNQNVIFKNPDMHVQSSLSGMKIPKEEFRHNNMQPFGRVKAHNHENRQLETFTGTSSHYKPKREVVNLFQPEKDVSNIYGSQVNTQFYLDRAVQSRVKNNVLPFEQVQVGPGLGKSYSAKPTGGYQQLEVQDYARPKTVDDLRPGNKPKVTYSGRTVDGQKGSKPATIGQVSKNRVDTFYQNTPDRYFKTTGAFLKPIQHAQPVDKDTNRQTNSRDYTGIAYKNTKGVQTRGAVAQPMKTQLKNFNIGQATFVQPQHGDYGKASIQTYTNERDITQTRTYQSNIMTAVKALIAPIEDFIRPTKKQQLVGVRESMMQSTLPPKQTVYDPNNIARTTIKETILHETADLNVRGPVKNIVYDPDSIARTTLKETMVQETPDLNVRGPVKNIVYDPDGVARTTLKETMVQETADLNVKGYVKNIVYDPDGIARTTLKETMVQETADLNVKGPEKSRAYDPNSIAKTTIKETMVHEAQYANIKGHFEGSMVDPHASARTTTRETLPGTDTNLNIMSQQKKQMVYDPTDLPRPTIKETTLGLTRQYGNAGNPEQFQGSYKDQSYIVKETSRVHDEYAGNPSAQSANAYQTLDVVPKDTQRQELTDNDYFGVAQKQGAQAPMSYSDVYNATIDSLKEELEVGRNPTASSVKIASGVDSVFMSSNKIEQANEIIGNFERVNNITKDRLDVNFTKSPQEYGNTFNIDSDLLKAFKENPYTKPLDSSV